MKHENLYLEILWGLCFHSSIKNVAPPKFFGAKILTFRKNMLLSCNEIIIYQYYQRSHSIKFLFGLTWGFTHYLAQYQLKYDKNGFNLNRGYQLWQSFIDIPTRESNDLANYHGWQLSSLLLVSLIPKKNAQVWYLKGSHTIIGMFLLTPMEEILVYERLFFELPIVKVKDK